MPLSPLALRRTRRARPPKTLAERENSGPRIDVRLIILKSMVGFAVALDVAILTRLLFH